MFGTLAVRAKAAVWTAALPGAEGVINRVSANATGVLCYFLLPTLMTIAVPQDTPQ